MEDNNEKTKTTEARYIIIIPLFITVICGVLDLITVIDDLNEKIHWFEFLNTTFRSAIGYAFPSLISIIIVMLYQQGILKREDLYGIKQNCIGICTGVTVCYSAFFIFCLVIYNLVTAIIFIALTIAYCIFIYKICLNEKITTKEAKSQEELLSDFIQKNNQDI